MVDVTRPMPSNGNESFMGRTRGALRSVRSVLGGSGEYLQGLSTRIGTAFSSSLEESETPSSKTSSSQPANVPTKDVDAERKKLRFPRFRNGATYEDYDALIRRKLEHQEMSRKSRVGKKYPMGMSYEEINAPDPRSTKKEQMRKSSNDEIIHDKESIKSTETMRDEDVKSSASEFDKLNNKIARAPNRYQTVVFRLDMTSSSSASEYENYGRSRSVDSNVENRDWPRSGSSGSIQSWGSSLSAESQSEEAAAEFMKSFVPLLFEKPAKIEQEQKANFGQMVLTEAGRIWFARVVNARRSRPCVSEESFYSLAQHFAVALFECNEADDFAPAKSLMNMCFTFYHEIEVPGIEPYREYLYTNLRVQPIWTSMRFWTAAFFDAVQCERAAKPVPPRPKTVDQEIAAAEDRKFQANICFGQLGTFTCNMHAFGLPRNLCLEFLKKQCIIANLTQDQEKILRDNIQKMFDETEPWR